MRAPAMTRRLRSLVTLALLAPCGCAGEPPPEAARAPVLVVKHGKLFGDPAPFAALLAEFERRHRPVTVRSETLPAASDTQHQFYVINLSAGAADFDVFAADVIWIAELAAAGWLAPLDVALPPPERERFFPAAIEAALWRGRAYAVPWFVDAGLLYYRADLLARHGHDGPPRTWEELVRAARTIAAAEGINGYLWQGRQYEGLVCNALEVMWSNGGGVLAHGAVALDRPANRQALGFMHALVHVHRVSPGWITTATEESSRRVFGDGRAVFLRNWPYAWRLFQRSGSAIRGKVGTAPLPHFAGHGSAATLGGWLLAVNPRSRHRETAEALVAFLTSPEAQAALALAYGLPPPRPALYADPALREAQVFPPGLPAILARARPRPVTPDYAVVSEILQGELSAAIAGLKPPARALAEAQAAIDRARRR